MERDKKGIAGVSEELGIGKAKIRTYIYTKRYLTIII